MNSITIVGTIASKIMHTNGQYGCYLKDDDNLFYIWMSEGIIKRVKAGSILNKGTEVFIIGRIIHTFNKNGKTIIAVGAYKLQPLASVALKNSIVSPSKPKKKKEEKKIVEDEDGNDIIPVNVRDILNGQFEGEEA